MQVRYSKRFQKQFKKAPKNIQKKFISRLEIFIKDPNHPVLKNHKLIGSMYGTRSINITADWRALYDDADEDSPLFVLFGTHSQLYK